MIPLHKLEKLPRSQRLRKIIKVCAEAEQRLCETRLREARVCEAQPTADAKLPADANGPADAAGFSAEALVFFAGAAELLACDPLFQTGAAEAFGKAARAFREPAGSAALRRALNTVRHLLLAETGRFPADWDCIGGGGRLDPARRRAFSGMRVYLEDIRSPFNVGAMFRAAESFGAETLYLSPFCADPRHPRAARTAMGCVDMLPWERRNFFAVENAAAGTSNAGISAAADIPPDGPVFALETGGTPLARFPFPRRGLLIAGSEELGVSPAALAAADASLGRVSIQCYGAKGSLNVSVAFGIVMQAWASALSESALAKSAFSENTLAGSV